jgi:peroxiredoxin
MTAVLLRASLVTSLTLLAAAGCRSAPSWMQDGMKAPELSGSTVDGQSVSLAEQHGKVAAVVFFADWCPHCRSLYATERELAQRMDGKPFVLLGVATDNTPEELRAAMARENITWPVIRDDGKNATAWGVTGLPTTYLIDDQGIIRSFGLRGDSLVEGADALIAETARRAR